MMRAVALVGLAASLVPTAASAKPLAVGVVPIRGEASGTKRREVTQAIEQALGDLPDLSVVSLENLGAVLGEDAANRLEACHDDPCVRAATREVRTDRLVVGELDLEEKLVLRIRLLDTATTSPARVRITRDVPPGPRGLAQAASAIVSDLFPERAKAARGLLAVAANVDEANVYVDGTLVGTTSGGPDGVYRALVRVPAGKRAVTVEARGHFATTTSAEVLLGERTDVAVELDKNRSSSPLILGGVGLAALAIGTIVGVTTKSTVDGWSSACAGARCDEGFTRARYATDESAVSRGAVVTNGLLIAGSAAVIGAFVWYLLDPGEDVVVDASGAVVGWAW